MTTKKSQTWFDVDRTGLRKLFADRGIEFAVFELIQNAWDEKGVSRVDVTLEKAKKTDRAMLTVTDNSDDGFSDLRHAYTLFAESAKKINPQQRGRFNVGEKLVLSLCDWAMITTTKGTVVFDREGRSQSPTRRKYGTQFQALIRMSVDEIDQVREAMQKLIAPQGIETWFNDVGLPQRTIERSIEATLPTVIADDLGDLRHSRRKTTINCYALRNGEKALIYEMGIPVVEHDCAFHCDVQQKVELTLDRSNVSERFLRALRLEVFNATHEQLTTEEVNHTWAQTAIEHRDVKPEAVKDYMTKRFGELRASYDMSDPEANNAAVAHGYTLVHGSMLTKEAWHNVRENEAITPAGQLFPTHPGNGVPFKECEQTDAMKRVAEYTRK